MRRTYVEVSCRHLPNGAAVPLSITWRDGRVWEITRVVHSCIASNHEFEGIRYTVLIGRAEKYLYQSGSRWYVESG